MLAKYFHSNRPLLYFTFLNLLDKALIFLTPFLVLAVFNANSLYVFLEYIISTVNIYAAVADLGMGGYIFYLYQGAEDKKSAIRLGRTVYETVFLGLIVLCFLLLVFDHYFVTVDLLLYYILIRILFVYLSGFFTSYFRLLDKPSHAVYISLVVNLSTLVLMGLCYLAGWAFSLWIIFVPQALLVVGFIGRVIFDSGFRTLSFRPVFRVVADSIKFSWPSIIQVFLMMYMSNYGKINALDKLTTEEGVFLGFTLRFCLVIQLAHASLIGYYAKAILAGDEKYVISRRIFGLYTVAVTFTSVLVCAALILYRNYFTDLPYSGKEVLMVVMFALYTLFWCFYSYLEMYFARINRNRIKLYLTFIILFVFIILLRFLNFNLLQNIAFAMFFSILAGLLANVWILKKLKFSLA